MSNASLGWLTVGLLAALAACGGDTPAAKPPPVPTAKPTAAPKPDPVPDPVDESAGDGGGSPGGDGGASAGGEVTPEPKRSSGRPAILMGPSSEIKSTFGLTPGAVLKLKGVKGSITLKLPEFSLPAPVNISWSLMKKAIKTKSRVIGSLAKLETAKTKRNRAATFNAADAQFEMRWPLMGQSSINLAIGTMQLGSNGEAGPVTWQVVAPTRVEEGLGEAYFQLSSIGPIQYYHATTAEPTAAP